MKKRLVIGSRGSSLALIQAEWVRSKIVSRFPGVEVSIEKIRTEGDIRVDHPLTGKGRKGFYTAEIEKYLAKGKIDCAVHSLKDLPAGIDDMFLLAAITARVDPRDVFVSKRFTSLASLPGGAKVGTSSLRRMTQLKHIRPDLDVVQMRGNIDTRLRKLANGDADGLILAAAGLIRAAREEEICEYISPEVMLPSAGQGALGIEIRSDDSETRSVVSFLNDEIEATAIRAERAFIRKLGGGCQVPITAYGTVSDGRLRLCGMVASVDGTNILRDEVTSGTSKPEEVGLELAGRLLAKGAQPLIDEAIAYIETS